MTQQLPLQIESAQDYLDRLIRELHALSSERRQPLVTVLEYVSQHIRLTRAEIGGLRSGDGAPLSTTADEIMGAAESIEAIAQGTDSATRAALEAAATRIYIASSFQDITGQRITKVVKALQAIEAKVLSLSDAYANLGISNEAAARQKDGEDPSILLNGPMLPADAMGQAAIDALLNDF